MRLHQKIFVAGHTGMLGRSLMKTLKDKSYKNVITRTHEELDLLDGKAVRQFFEEEKPEFVFLAAARHGSMAENATNPANIIYENIQIQNNVIHQSYVHGVKKLLFYACSSIYPVDAPQPINENLLLTSFFDIRVEPIAMAKLAGIKMCISYNKQYKTKFMAAVPVSLFGPFDKFVPGNSNVIPTLIQLMQKAKKCGNDVVNLPFHHDIWREYLFVEDMSAFSLIMMRNEINSGYINVGTGRLASMKEVSHLIRRNLGYAGKIKYNEANNTEVPAVGFMRQKTEELAWAAETNLEKGIKKTCEWYLEQNS